MYTCTRIIVTLTFNNYTPSFAPNSMISGELTATITLDLDSDKPTVTIVFHNDDLTVVGEHAGDYIYDAVLIIDLSAGEYTYSGEVTIYGKVHKTG